MKNWQTIMKTLNCIPVFAFCFFLLFSCNSKSDKVNHVFNEVSNLVEEYPDSALAILDTLHLSVRFDERQNAEYLLLNTQAKDKAYKDISKDTEIYKASDYFKKEKDWNKAVLAKFYSGRVYQSQKDYKQALQVYLEAETLSERINDDTLKGLIQYFMGEVYYIQDFQSEAISKFKIAYEYFSKSANNYKREIPVLNLIASSYLLEREKDSAFFYFNKALYLANVNNDSSQIVRVKRNLGIALMNEGKLDDAKGNFISALSYANDKEQLAYASLNLALVYSDLNRRDSTEFYIDKALEFFHEHKNAASLSTAYYLLSSLEASDGNFEKALRYKDEYINYLNEVWREKDENNVQEAEHKYNYELIQNERNELLIQRQKIFILALLLVFIAVVVYFYYYRKNAHEKEIRLEKEVALAKAEQQVFELQKLADSFDKKEHTLRNIVIDHFEILKKASSIERDMHDSNKSSSREFIQRMNKVLYGQEEHNWDKLFHSMDKSHNDFFSKLRKEYPQLTDQEYKICCLTYAGFSNTEIAIIIKAAKNTVQQRKTDIRQKLSIEERGDIKAFFDVNLNMK